MIGETIYLNYYRVHFLVAINSLDDLILDYSSTIPNGVGQASASL